MRFVVTLLTAGLFVLTSVGSAQKVRFDFDHGANFSNYHTYRLVKIADNPQVNQLADQRILSAMEEELAKKGLKKVDSEGDVLVGYQASLQHEQQYTTFNNGFGPGWGYGWGGGGISTTTSTSIPIGTLVVDMMDPAKKQLVFRATASDTLSDKPEKNANKIQKAMKKIFEKYPPKT